MRCLLLAMLAATLAGCVTDVLLGPEGRDGGGLDSRAADAATPDGGGDPAEADAEPDAALPDAP